MAEVVLPDGNVAKIPDFAMEKTQNDMKQLLSALVGADEKALKIYENIFKNAREQKAQTKENAKELQDLTKEGNKALEEVADAAKKGKIFTGDNLMKGVNKLDGWLTKSFLGLGGAAITAAGFVASGVKGLGDELLGLQQLGVGFTDATGSAEKLIADLGYLGMTAGQASNLMGDFAGVVQVMGKTGFGEIQKTFAKLSNNGNNFGLSIAESAEVLAEDLALRKRLGMMENINSAKAAAESAALYKQQMKAAQMLGKSIEEIRKESDNLVESNIQAQLAINQLGPEAIGSFRSFATELSGMNIDQNLADGIMTAMAEPVAFASAGGQELFAALSASGEEGMRLIKEIEEVNALKVSDPEEFNKRVKEMGPKIGQALSRMSKDPKVAKSQAELISAGAVGADMMGKIAVSGMSANSALIAAANAADSVQSPLARGAQAFDASMNTLSGSLSGMSTDLFAAFGAPMEGFANAMSKSQKTLDGRIISEEELAKLSDEEKARVVESQSVMSAFKDAMEVVRATVMESFGIVGESTDGFAEKIRNTIIPAIEGFADWFEGGGFAMVKSAFGFLIDVGKGIFSVFGFVIKAATSLYNGFVTAATFVKEFGESVASLFGPGGIYEPIGNAFSYLGEKIGIVTDAIGNLYTSIFGAPEETEEGEGKDGGMSLGKTIGIAIGSLFLFTKAIKLATGVAGLFGKAKSGVQSAMSLFGKGGGGAVASAGQSAAGGVGDAVAKGGAGFTKTIAKAGANIGSAIKNLGKGIGGAIQGLAEGIGQGVAAVGKGIGTALGAILQGLAKGLAAFANPTILIGAAILGGAITVIGAGIAGAAWIMGKALPTFAEGLNSFANIDGDNLVNVAKGIGAIGVAMAAMGAGGAAGSVGTAVSGVVDGIMGFFGADDPLDKINEFAEYEFDVAKVLENAGAVQAFGEAMLALGAGTGAAGLGGALEALASFAGAGPLDLLKKFSEEQIDIAGIDHNIAAMDRLTVLFAKFADLPVPENAEAIAGTAEAIDKSAPAGGGGQNAYQRATARNKRKEALMQPGVMAVDKNGNPVDTGATNAQMAAIQEQAKASGNQAGGSSYTESSSTSNDPEVLKRIEQHLASIAGSSSKQVKGLKKLDQSVQDDF